MVWNRRSFALLQKAYQKQCATSYDFQMARTSVIMFQYPHLLQCYEFKERLILAIRLSVKGLIREQISRSHNWFMEIIKTPRYRTLIQEDLYYDFIREKRPLKKLLKRKELEFMAELKKRISMFESGIRIQIHDAKLYSKLLGENQSFMLEPLQSRYFRYRKKLKDYMKFKTHIRLFRRYMDKRYKAYCISPLPGLLNDFDPHLRDLVGLKKPTVTAEESSLSYRNIFKEYASGSRRLFSPPIELEIFKFRKSLYRNFHQFLSI